MARAFTETRWTLTRSEVGPQTVEVYGFVKVTDADGDSSSQQFNQVDLWSDVPPTVKQAIGAAWTAYHDWLAARRLAREL